jgi:phosphatidylglycerophosphate synthase
MECSLRVAADPPPSVAPVREAASAWPPRTALVLPPSHGTAAPGVRVAGLSLLERSLLALRAAGIEDFRVMVGSDAERISAEGLAARHGLAVAVVGASCVPAGGFLIAPADQVIDAAFVGDFLARAATSPATPQIASRGGVRGGLLYVPSGSGRRIGALLASGAGTLAEIAAGMAAGQRPIAVPVEQGVWQEISGPATAREAERRLLGSLAKSTDGFVSRHLNRRISIAVSRYLARWNVRPNLITTVVFLISLAGAFMAQTADPLWLAAGGILFQLASILDGCDGEVARLKFQGSKWGGWYDTVSDNVRYMVFYAALGVAAFRLSGAEIYLWALIPFLALSTFFVATMARYTLSTQSHYTNLAVTKKVLSGDRTRWWERLVLPLSGLIKQDVQAFIAMMFCLVGLPGPYFWLIVAGSVMMTVSVVRGLGGEGTAEARARV